MKLNEIQIACDLVTVCAWCMPGETCFETRPELNGMKLSHGICEEHLKQQMELLCCQPTGNLNTNHP
jgi:hypothetical protein